ncbi:hypothetical protein ACFLY6_00310 [Candidatus Dependentiae bacterium]
MKLFFSKKILLSFVLLLFPYFVGASDFFRNRIEEFSKRSGEFSRYCVITSVAFFIGGYASANSRTHGGLSLKEYCIFLLTGNKKLRQFPGKEGEESVSRKVKISQFGRVLAWGVRLSAFFSAVFGAVYLSNEFTTMRNRWASDKKNLDKLVKDCRNLEKEIGLVHGDVLTDDSTEEDCAEQVRRLKEHLKWLQKKKVEVEEERERKKLDELLGKCEALEKDIADQFEDFPVRLCGSGVESHEDQTKHMEERLRWLREKSKEIRESIDRDIRLNIMTNMQQYLGSLRSGANVVVGGGYRPVDQLAITETLKTVSFLEECLSYLNIVGLGGYPVDHIHALYFKEFQCCDYPQWISEEIAGKDYSGIQQLINGKIVDALYPHVRDFVLLDENAANAQNKIKFLERQVLEFQKLVVSVKSLRPKVEKKGKWQEISAEEADDGHTCVVCMAKPQDCIVVQQFCDGVNGKPCRGWVCDECTVRIYEGGVKDENVPCPICGHPVAGLK